MIPNQLIQFRFPNLWQNWLSDDRRLVITFVSVDDDNTLMYIRVRVSFSRATTQAVWAWRLAPVPTQHSVQLLGAAH